MSPIEAMREAAANLLDASADKQEREWKEYLATGADGSATSLHAIPRAYAAAIRALPLPDSPAAASTDTDPALLALLERAAGRGMTPEEEFEQRVSFVWGQLPWKDKRSREEVRESVRMHMALAKLPASTADALLAELVACKDWMSKLPQDVSEAAYFVAKKNAEAKEIELWAAALAYLGRT